MRRLFRKAGMMDLDLLVVGILDHVPSESDLLYGALHLHAETGAGVVGILSPTLPGARLTNANYVRAITKRLEGGK